MTINIGSILPVGTIIHSMLSTTQFATQYGDNWVLADGRSVTGTLYASVTGSSTIPDMRGTFLRGKDHGNGRNADGNIALGTYADDRFKTHVHQEQGAGTNSSAAVPAYLKANVGGANINSVLSTGFSEKSDFNDSLAPLNTLATGTNETAPKSITVNIFIRIN